MHAQWADSEAPRVCDRRWQGEWAEMGVGAFLGAHNSHRVRVDCHPLLFSRCRRVDHQEDESG